MYIRLEFRVLLIFYCVLQILCWTDEDLQLFDLVESTDRKFYDILGVDQKASSNDIRKAYRKLSQQYHPDRNKEPNAEETFRKIAAIAEVLRNEEQRKKYDVILQTGLPDWREPIYYYRRARNMGLIELMVFLFSLATFGQYLLSWAIYWERKYEIEEVFSSKLKKKIKHQRKGKNTKTMEEVEQTSLEIENLPKPRYQDLFPIRLACFFVHLVRHSPSYLKLCLEHLQSLRNTTTDNNSEEEESDSENYKKRESRPRMKKHVEPLYPELTTEESSEKAKNTCEVQNGSCKTELKKIDAESDLQEFKKALKKFPNGTLQRWEKIADYLNCPVSEVVSLAKDMKLHQFSKNVPISAQGLTGLNDFPESTDMPTQSGTNHNGIESNGNVTHRNAKVEVTCTPENNWKQEEQRLLEQALQKFTKDMPARWDRIAEYIQSKSKEECILRYKWLAQEIKRKKDKKQ